MSSNLVLGLDPSLSSYGWCVYDTEATGPEKIRAKGVWKTSADMLEVLRYRYLHSQILKCLREYQILKVGMETPPVGSQAYSQERLYALFVYNQDALYEYGANVVFLAPTQLQMLTRDLDEQKVSASSWGKKDMVRVAYKDMGIESVTKANKLTSDVADAYHAARCASRFFSLLEGTIKEADLSGAEWKAYINRHTYTMGPRKGTTESEGILYKEGSRFFRFSSMKNSLPQAK